MVLKGHFSNPSSQVTRLFQALTLAADASARPATPPDHQRQLQRRLPAELVSELLAAYQGGASLSELSGKFQVHRTTVMAHLDRHGVPRRGQQRKLTGQQVIQASQLYRSGWSLVKIGDHFQVDAATVRRALRRAGFQLRRPGRQPKH